VYQNQVLKGLFNTSSYLRTAALSKRYITSVDAMSYFSGPQFRCKVWLMASQLSPIAGPLFAENCHRCVPRFAIRIRGGFLSHMQELVTMLQKVIDPFIDAPVMKVRGTRHA
jgi:hypothetical protein